MPRGVHGEKILAALNSSKLPEVDRSRLEDALQKYDCWMTNLQEVDAATVDQLIQKMVDLLNEYKFYIDVDLIFDSPDDFLYRQKGQLKLDNSIVEEFLPILVRKCIIKEFGRCDIDINSQTDTFSSTYFVSGLNYPVVGGGMRVKTKKQDFSMSRPLYLQSSYNPSFDPAETVAVTTHLGYVLAEIKTNLDKTMYQEASATAHDIKLAVTGAKYYLLCDYLDMTPISTATSDIDEILILRKTRRISSHIRKVFSTFSGRQSYRDWYVEYLKSNPYSYKVFKRFVDHIFSQMKNEDLIEESILNLGYF